MSLGLRVLECAAACALVVATWLRDEYHEPEAPLASVQMLPLPAERELGEPEMAAAGAATPAAIRDALADWRAACTDDPDGVAILYVAGHGVMISPDAAIVVLLEEFARHDGMEFDAAVDLQEVRLGMRGRRLPRRQHYFADACVFALQLLPGLEVRGGVTLSPGEVLGTSTAPVDCRAVPGTLADGTQTRHPLHDAIARVLAEHRSAPLWFNYRSAYTELWGREDVVAHYGHAARMPTGTPGMAIELQPI